MIVTYEKTSFTLDNGKELEIITRISETESFSIPKDPANRHYAEYLRYTAWVEAGNDPDEFWTQDGGI